MVNVNSSYASQGTSLDTLMMNLARQDDALMLSALKDSSATMQHTSAERKEWRASMIEKLQTAATQSKQVNGWSLFSKILGYFSGVFAVLSGAALVATGAAAVAGAALIITGSLTLGSQICKEAGLTRYIAEKATAGNPQKTEKLLTQIDLGLSITTTILSVATALISAAQIANLAAKTAIGTAQSFVAGGEGIAAIGTSVSESKQIKANAEAAHLQAKVDSSDRKMRHLNHLTEEALKDEETSLVKAFMDSKAARIKIFYQKQRNAAAAAG